MMPYMCYSSLRPRVGSATLRPRSFCLALLRLLLLTAAFAIRGYDSCSAAGFEPLGYRLVVTVHTGGVPSPCMSP
jgi:hypothetical protein